MKREEKNALSRQRILDAALNEFSEHGYDMASMNAICAENDISKGIIYHYFKDKDLLYLSCVGECFEKLTACLSEEAKTLSGTAEERLRGYFDARARVFAQNRIYLGIFADAVFSPPENLTAAISQLRGSFDRLNISVLTELLENEPLREGLAISQVVEDFGMYMDFFNVHFRSKLSPDSSGDALMREHEKRCHRQIDILLHGVIGEKNER